MYGRTNNGGDPYFGELNIPVDLPSGILFEVSFWSLIYCNDPDCLNADDSIRVILGDYQIDINYLTVQQQRAWEKMSFNFRSDSRVTEVRNELEFNN